MLSFLNALILDQIFDVDADSSSYSRRLDEANQDVELTHHHIVDAVIITVAAWLTMVVTLEVNDFRHRLMATYKESSADENTKRRYTAALMAIQYGMYNAFIDWGLTYSICAAIVGGITWYNANQNLVTVIWGISLLCSAFLLTVAGLKIPEWLGYYRKSQLKTIRDTSGFSAQAVNEFIDGGTISAFRYQVRLGVGKHFSQFVWFQLPFYVDFKFYWYLLSMFLGVLGGQVFLSIVFKCRKQFTNNRGRVAMGASTVFSVASAVCFMVGVWIVETSWGLNVLDNSVLLPVAFFAWLAFTLVLQAVKYHEHRKMSTQEASDLPFESTLRELTQDVVDVEGEPNSENDGGDGVEDSSTKNSKQEGDDGVEISSSMKSSNRREVMHKDSMNATGQGYFYQTAYFDRVNIKKSLEGSNGNGSGVSDAQPRDVYKSFVEEEDMKVSCFGRFWRVLPFISFWGLLLAGSRDMNCCSCNKDESRQSVSGFQSMSTCKKGWFVFAKIVKLLVNAAAIFLAIIAMGGAVQATVSKQKMPYVHQRYAGLNTNQVCAYTSKCAPGQPSTYANKEAADAANATVIHCGKCSGCSSWQDLSVQWNTRKDAAKLSQSCGLRNMFNRDNMAQCLSDDMGWTTDCAYAWVHSVECAKENCMFIAVTAMITNKLGNFKVEPGMITPANCNEAQCEQGNPGRFAELSGASRRKMNIPSDIKRPKDQQCQIIEAVPLDEKGFSNWTGYFEPLCPRSASPP